MKHHKSLLGAAMSAAIFVTFSAQPALAAPADDLRCLDDQLDDNQRAAIGSLFAEQTDDPTKERELAKGSSAAANDFAVTVGGCASRFNWNNAERRAAEQYLIKLGRLSKIAVTNGEQWALAMDKYARFGKRLLPTEGDVTKHQQAMIIAGAKANDVTIQAADADEKSPIVRYLIASANLEKARNVFQSK